jgi:hypothetical protein
MFSFLELRHTWYKQKGLVGCEEKGTQCIHTNIICYKQIGVEYWKHFVRDPCHERCLSEWTRNCKCQVPVAHSCNPSYLEGRDQEDRDLKPAQKNSSRDPISKIPITKKGWWVTQGVGPEFKSQYQNQKQQQKPARYAKYHGVDS